MSAAPSTVATLFDTAAEVLAVAEDALADTVGGTPERSYVAHSEPAFDCCPFLTVHVPGLTEGTTSDGPGSLGASQRTRRGNIIVASFVVLAIRCAPLSENGKLPSPTAIEVVAEMVLQDGWALWNRLRQAIRDGEIFGLCQEVYFDGGLSVVEQGGCVGWRFNLRASVPGYQSGGSA